MPEPTFSEQWTAKALDTVDTVVATVNDRAVRPAILAARAIVFGIIIGAVGTTVLVLLCAGLLRLMVVYIPGHHVWVSYGILGGFFCLIGILLYSRRGSVHPVHD